MAGKASNALAENRRFAFGANWNRFLAHVDEERIAQAERALTMMIGDDGVRGRSFIDVGSGSGLFSLAAVRLGACRVHSFDYDRMSVACTESLKSRYFPSAAHWTVEQGDVLDDGYVRQLGKWQIVYSWGVLHHTGHMKRAICNAASLAARPGIVFVSIYNDQGWQSKYWRGVKRLYNRDALSRTGVLATFIPYFAARALAADIVRLRDPRRRYREYKRMRGMSLLHDWVDWLGGYPFEVAKPEEIIELLQSHALVLHKLKTCGGSLGCNEFVFRKVE